MSRFVWWFEKLMWVSMLVGAIGFALDWDRLMIRLVQRGADAHIPVYYLRFRIQAMSVAMSVVAVVTLLVLLILVWLIARRRMNWARWVYATLFVLGLPYAVIQLPDMLSANPTAGALSGVQLALQLTALVLVFSPSARPWFTRPVVGAEVV
jgi:hypothetical protein